MLIFRKSLREKSSGREKLPSDFVEIHQRGIERHAERNQKKLLFSFFIHCSFLHLPRVRSATGAEVPNAVHILSG